MTSVIKEFCAENFETIAAAIDSGANRIELCDNLAVGGTTPSYGVIKHALAIAHSKEVPVMTMIRPRGGDFSFSEEESAAMLADITICRRLGSDGVVFGCLKNGWIDEEVMERLIKASGEMQITFHMAFDELTVEKQLKAIDWLSQRNVHRILTHGGPAHKSIVENFAHLRKLIEYAADRLIILPGAGITYRNAASVLDALSINEVHGTKIVPL